MKITLLNDTDGRENIGCRLTSQMLKRALQTELARHEDAQVQGRPWLFGRGTRGWRAWMQAVSWMAARSDRLAAFLRWLEKLARIEYSSATVDDALASDIVVLQPEGSIADSDGIQRILSLISLPLLCAAKGVPIFVMNGTLPLFEGRRLRILKAFLQCCDYVALRDRISAEHYSERFVPDAALLWEGSPKEEAEREFVLITTGAEKTKAENLAIALQGLELSKQRELRPLVMTKKAKHLLGLRDQVRGLGGQFLEGYVDLDEASQWVSKCALHLGGRYHMAILALTHDVPSALVSVNTHKNTWLQQEFVGVEVVGTVEELCLVGDRLLSAENAGLHEAVATTRRAVLRELVDACELMRRAQQGRHTVSAKELLAVGNELSIRDCLPPW